MSQDLKAVVKQDAHSLSIYWKSKDTEIYDFYFSNSDVFLFSENEILALINLTRVCLKLLDEVILSTINDTDIAKYELHEFLNNKKLNVLKASVKARKFRGVLKKKYGASIGCTDEEFRLYLESATELP